jgi:hypothetical protein
MKRGRGAVAIEVSAGARVGIAVGGALVGVTAVPVAAHAAAISVTSPRNTRRRVIFIGSLSVDRAHFDEQQSGRLSVSALII